MGLIAYVYVLEKVADKLKEVKDDDRKHPVYDEEVELRQLALNIHLYLKELPAQVSEGHYYINVY